MPDPRTPSRSTHANSSAFSGSDNKRLHDWFGREFNQLDKMTARKSPNFKDGQSSSSLQWPPSITLLASEQRHDSYTTIATSTYALPSSPIARAQAVDTTTTSTFAIPNSPSARPQTVDMSTSSGQTTSSGQSRMYSVPDRARPRTASTTSPKPAQSLQYSDSSPSILLGSRPRFDSAPEVHASNLLPIRMNRCIFELNLGSLKSPTPSVGHHVYFCLSPSQKIQFFP
jgi:hypothetical protein